jgi:hypothetical protein
MTIYGISQTTGVERKLKVEMGAHGLVLIFVDHKGGQERGRILVQVNDVLTAVTEPVAGGSTVEGIAPPNGPKMLLSVEVRRNELLLKAGPDSDGPDIAVGLDDFQDAMEGAMNRA